MLSRDSRYRVDCINAVLPYVSRVILFIDSRSDYRYYPPDPKVFWRIREAEDPLLDLVRFRNEQLKITTEKWVWVVDDDEFYPRDVVRKIIQKVGHASAYAIPFWPLWDKTRYHKATARAYAPRVFRNTGRLEWRGLFGKEKLFVNGQVPTAERLPFRYIHFTHVKKSAWRSEMGQERKADDRSLGTTPIEIINEVRHLL